MDKTANQDDGILASGVLFSRSVRSSFASLSLVSVDHNGNNRSTSNGCEQSPILIRIQFLDNVKEFRSLCRRYLKLGDILHVMEGLHKSLGSNVETEWNDTRLVINLKTIEELEKAIVIAKVRHWNMPECQVWQNRYFSKMKEANEEEIETNCRTNETSTGKNCKKQYYQNDSNNNQGGHGDDINKRQQGKHVANFLIHAIMTTFLLHDDNSGKRKNLLVDASGFAESMDPSTYKSTRQKAIEFLNSGSGVLDVAGGSGHVSMALGLAGVHSTVVDPRPTVGKLPKRDRKIWNRALKSNQNTHSTVAKDELIICKPIVPYQALRAWFGPRPDGVDSTFRQPDEEDVSICDESDKLVTSCSAIIALHPDEATGTIVEVAVRNRKTFVIVPCCVFCRLFPHRRKPSNDQLVSTYDDLLEFLQHKDPSIQSATLPFQGKNTVLWAVF